MSRERRGPRQLSEIIREHIERAGVEPGVHHVEVRHDDDCPFWDGHACDCEPEILSGPAIDRKHER